MKKVIQDIFRKEFNSTIQSYRKIEGLGSVNLVYDIRVGNEAYILRMNEDHNKLLEYKKETWCLNEIASRGIPTAKVLCQGIYKDHLYMIQTKVHGISGTKINSYDKKNLWKTLGDYAKIYHQIKRIKNREVEEAEFHKNWKSRLQYNLDELNPNDSLLSNKTFNQLEHEQARLKLAILKCKYFKVGLIHGDLCPRNVIVDDRSIFLLDWGTAEINVIPHVELGILMMMDEVSKEEFQLFIKGYGISFAEFKLIEGEINLLNFLHRLDKYRWAETYDSENINDYAIKVRNTFEKLF